MRKVCQVGSRFSETSRFGVGLGATWAIALSTFGGCTTEDPRETFPAKTQAPPFGAAGSPPASGGSPTGGRGGKAQAGSQGMSDAGRNGTGGSSGVNGMSGNGSANSSGGDSGEDGVGGESGSLSTGSGATGGSSTTGGSSGASGGGSGPLDECGERPVSSEPFSKQALRTAAADCAIWHYCKFEAEATRLQASIAAEVAEPTPGNLEAAQNGWKSAMAAWAAVELFQFGPVASRAESESKDIVHGQGLREFVYSWPRFTRCRVEEQVASQRYETQGFANVPIASRGLFGIEYLLFYEGSDTACAPETATATTWATLDAADLAERKSKYGTALAADVLATTRQLIELWTPSGQNFRQTFIDAAGYESEQQALTILAWSLIYIEREVKDWKLGVPLGITLTHPVNGPEAPFARFGTENIRQNLRGFRALFQGCGVSGEGLGFDDWLTEAGHAALGQDIVVALDAADAFASTFPPLDAASPEELESFYTTIKVLTDLLKSDLFGDGSPLNLDLPDGVKGDTD